MSLQLWFPLIDENVNKNLGLLPVTFYHDATAISTQVSNGGKISDKCWEYNTVPFRTNSFHIPSTSIFSIAGWVRLSGEDANNGYLYGLTIGTKANFMLYLYNNNNVIRVYLNGSNRLAYTHGLDLTQWTHIVATYDGTTIKLYINGDLKSSVTRATTITVSECFYIGPRSDTNGVAYGKAHTFYNDVRYYDHCLSPLEVKELAQGLVVHYKLDDPYGLMPNHLRDSNAPSLDAINASRARYIESSGSGTYTTTFEEILDPPVSGIKYGIRQVVSSAKKFHSQVWYSGGNIAAENGIEYTMSCWVKWISGNNPKLVFQYGKSPYESTTLNIIPDGQWHRYSWTFIPTASAASSNTTKIYCGGLSTVGEVLICGYKYERGTVATDWSEAAQDSPLWEQVQTKIMDSSGYHHIGTCNGTRRLVSGTPRYNCGHYLQNGTVDYITSNISIPMFPITMSIWFKSANTTPTGDYHSIYRLQNADSTAAIGAFVSNTGLFRAGAKSESIRNFSDVANTNALDNQWHMLTITYDGSSFKKYYDSELVDTTTISINTAPMVTTLLLGKMDGYACQQAFISDFRIYSTVLLDSDIKRLYNVSVQIDRDSNLHAFQLHESNNNRITKSGELECATGDEYNFTTNIKNNKNGTWTAKTFIER